MKKRRREEEQMKPLEHFHQGRAWNEAPMSRSTRGPGWTRTWGPGVGGSSCPPPACCSACCAGSAGQRASAGPGSGSWGTRPVHRNTEERSVLNTLCLPPPNKDQLISVRQSPRGAGAPSARCTAPGPDPDRPAAAPAGWAAEGRAPPLC